MFNDRQPDVPGNQNALSIHNACLSLGIPNGAKPCTVVVIHRPSCAKLDRIHAPVRREPLSQARNATHSTSPDQLIMLKHPIPSRLTYRLQSEPIIVRIPQADPLLTIHLHRNELIFDPPYVVFTRSAEASFRTCTCRMPRHICTCRTHALPSACSRVQHTPTHSRVQHTCTCSWVQPTHAFEGSTHQWGCYPLS